MIGKLIYLSGIIFLLLSSGLISGCLNRETVPLDLQSGNNINAICSSVSSDKTMTAIAHIELVTKHGYQNARAAIAMKRPSYLRLEILPLIGTPDFFLVANPDEMSIFIPSQGDYYRGAPKGENFSKFLSWDFSIEDMVMILSGTYPTSPEKDLLSKSDRDGNFKRIEIKSKSGSSQVVWIGENNRLSRYMCSDKLGKEIYSVQYEDYQPESTIAGKITIKMADGINSISVKYSDLKIEAIDDLSIFQLPVPENTKIIFLN